MAAIIEMRRYIDQQTGELLSTQVKPLPDYFEPEKGYRMLARTKNIRIFPLIPFPEELSYTDLGRLLTLSRLMWADTGILVKYKNRLPIPLNDEEIIECAGFKIGRKGKQWLKRMRELSIMRPIDVHLSDGSKERQWYMNPLYFCPMFITRDVYLKWRNEIGEHIPEKIKKIWGVE